MFSAKGGLFRSVSGPAFGRQDIGHCPGGAQDRFSFFTGNLVLGNPQDSLALEIVLPPALECESDCFFMLAGAGYREIFLESPSGVRGPVRRNRVTPAHKGDRLVLRERTHGFRAYLCTREAASCADRSPEGWERGAFSEIASWPDPGRFIRVLAGPEGGWLSRFPDFTRSAWKIGPASADTGLYLEGPSLDCDRPLLDMVSSPVADGTVQITAKGPIALLRLRQTVGGYPRIACVIDPDVDLLAQHAPGQQVRFREVALEEAGEIGERYRGDLKLSDIR